MGHDNQSPPARRPSAQALAARTSAADVSRFTAIWFAFGLVTTLLLLLAAAYLAV